MKKETKKEYMHIRISPILKEQLQDLADKQGKALSELIIDLCKLEIAKQEK